MPIWIARQASYKPQGRKPRNALARYERANELWRFDRLLGPRPGNVTGTMHFDTVPVPDLGAIRPGY
jgi:hypothetical protein